MEVQQIKKLEGFLSFREVAVELGYRSRQAVHALVFDSLAFDVNDLRYVEGGNRSIYLIRESAVMAEKRKRESEPQRLERQRQEAEKTRLAQVAAVAARKRMRTLLGQLDIWGKPARIDCVSDALGRTVDDWFNLDADDANTVIKHLIAQLDEKGESPI